MVREQFSRGQLPGGKFSSGAIVWGTIIQGAIIRGAIFLRGNRPRTVFNVRITILQKHHRNTTRIKHL